MLSINRLSRPRASSPAGVGVLIALLVCLGLLLHINFTDAAANAGLSPTPAAGVTSIDTYSVDEAALVLDELASESTAEACVYLGMLCALVTLLLVKVIAIRDPRDENVDALPALEQPRRSSVPLNAAEVSQPLRVALRI